MELKLARKELDSKPKSIKLEKIIEIVQKEGQKIFYFDKENSHKDLVALVEHFEKNDQSVYLREVKYGLGDDDYMYEIHIL
ncbi:MAG: hypothetical protein GXP61_09885 [Epsilonproteobacteria bacterium]|nr:hypothetical protein [Campylobacterota bacterium]